MMNFYKGGRGLAYGQGDKPTCRIKKKDIRYSVQNREGVWIPSRYKLILFLVSFRPIVGFQWWTRIKSTLLLVYGFVFCLFNSAAFGQSHSPSEAATEVVTPLVVGQKVPEEFWTKEHLFYVNGDTVRKDLSEYKGKLLLLDFWASWCGTCLQNFKKIDQLKNDFGDDLTFLLINSADTRDDLARVDRVLSDTTYFNGNSEVSIIFDKYFTERFPYLSLPRYVWIDPVGMVRAITTFDFISAAQINTILSRKIYRYGGNHHD